MKKKSFDELPEVVAVLGENYILTQYHIENISDLELKFKKLMRNADAKIIANFIKFDLQDWFWRLTELKKLKFTITEYRYILMMGEPAGKKYWESISETKKESQTEQSYIEKYGSLEGKKKWAEISDKRGMSAFRVEYWIQQGFTPEQATEKVTELAKKGSIEGNTVQTQQRETDYDAWAKKMPTTTQYWLNRGLTPAQAKHQVTRRQTTFSKEICIEKFGQEEGMKKWLARQEKWLDTISDIEMVNNSKKIGCASRESLTVFLPVTELLETCNLDYNLGIDGNKEFRLFGNDRLNLYDFVVPSLKLCFEYNGEKFHPNPKWKVENPELWDSWKHLTSFKSADETHIFDQEKIRLMQDNGFEVYELWSSDTVEHNVQLINDAILKKLKNHTFPIECSDVNSLF